MSGPEISDVAGIFENRSIPEIHDREVGSHVPARAASARRGRRRFVVDRLGAAVLSVEVRFNTSLDEAGTLFKKTTVEKLE